MAKISRINPLLEVMRSSPRRVSKLLVRKEQNRGRIQEVVKLANTNKIPVILAPQKHLDRMDRNNQGVVAFVASKGYSSFDDILKSSESAFLILLDGIEDPQNLGAIIRTADGAGVDGILLPGRRAAGLTDTVVSVSSGALEYTRIARVKNLARTMDMLRDKGVWLVGAEGGGSELWYDFDYTMPVGLVLGSEGKGLRPIIKEKCDKVLSLPLLGGVSSLNVAAAAAIFMYEVVRQRGR